MIKKEKTKVALEAFDEVPYCRTCCTRWSSCLGREVRKCHLILTILKIQEKKHGIIYTLGGKRITSVKS